MAPKSGNRFSDKAMRKGSSRVELCKCRKHGVEWLGRERTDNTLIRGEGAAAPLPRRRGRPAEAGRPREAIQRLLLQPLSLEFDRLDPGAQALGGSRVHH